MGIVDVLSNECKGVEDEWKNNANAGEGTVRAKVASAIVQISDEARAEHHPIYFLHIKCLVAYCRRSTSNVWPPPTVAQLLWQRQNYFFPRVWQFARLME